MPLRHKHPLTHHTLTHALTHPHVHTHTLTATPPLTHPHVHTHTHCHSTPHTPHATTFPTPQMSFHTTRTPQPALKTQRSALVCVCVWLRACVCVVETFIGLEVSPSTLTSHVRSPDINRFPTCCWSFPSSLCQTLSPSLSFFFLHFPSVILSARASIRHQYIFILFLWIHKQLRNAIPSGCFAPW